MSVKPSQGPPARANMRPQQMNPRAGALTWHPGRVPAPPRRNAARQVRRVSARLALAAVLGAGAGPCGTDGRATAAEPNASPGTSIIVAGQPFDVGKPVVLWSDPQGFDA